MDTGHSHNNIYSNAKGPGNSFITTATHNLTWIFALFLHYPVFDDFSNIYIMLSDFWKIQIKNYYASLKARACNMSEKQTALTHAKLEKKVFFFFQELGEMK